MTNVVFVSTRRPFGLVWKHKNCNLCDWKWEICAHIKWRHGKGKDMNLLWLLVFFCWSSLFFDRDLWLALFMVIRITRQQLFQDVVRTSDSLVIYSTGSRPKSQWDKLQLDESAGTKPFWGKRLSQILLKRQAHTLCTPAYFCFDHSSSGPIHSIFNSNVPSWVCCCSFFQDCSKNFSTAPFPMTWSAWGTGGTTLIPCPFFILNTGFLQTPRRSRSQSKEINQRGA